MKVTARFYGYVRQAVAKDELEICAPDGSTISDVMKLLAAKEDKMEEFLRADARGLIGLSIVVGGRLYPRSEWENISFSDTVSVDVLPPAMGGSQKECRRCWD